MGFTGSNGFDLTGHALSIGAVVPAGDGLRAIVEPGPARWHALRVAPQREDQASAWLRRRGVYAFHPVLTRRATRFGKVREFQRRYIPGLVFARFKGEALMHRVLACPFITGALRRADGSWGILEPRRMGQIHAMRKIDIAAEEHRKSKSAQRRAATMVRAGESALFTGGAFAGRECEVVELDGDGGAVVRIQLFGGDVLATVCSDVLERPHKAD